MQELAKKAVQMAISEHGKKSDPDIESMETIIRLQICKDIR